LERTEGEDAEVRLRAVDATGARAPFSAIARSSAARPAGFPRMVRAGDHLVLAWTEPGTPSRIRMAEGRLTHPR
jgi:hypothetical protein